MNISSCRATATLGSTVLFKDMLAYKICEDGVPTEAPARPSLAVIHEDGVILRDDFDSSTDINTDIWSHLSGGLVGDQCGTVLHDDSLVFCEPKGTRQLISKPLNLTTASVLQFSISAGTCTSESRDPSIMISYATFNEVDLDWHKVISLRAPTNGSTMTHVVHLPAEVQQDGICLRFLQEAPHLRSEFKGCWAMDNVAIVNAATRPTYLEDSFDPIDPGNWLFLPGGGIKHTCQSEGDAMGFWGTGEEDWNYVSTRDLDLLVEADNTSQVEHFEEKLPEGWEVEGGSISTFCGILHSGSSLIFAGADKRSICTPYMDTRDVGNVRFYFSMGGESCDPAESPDMEVEVYQSDSSSELVLTRLAYNAYKDAALVSVPVPTSAQKRSTRFCLRQLAHKGLNRNVWAVDEFQLLPRLPASVDHFAQFSVNIGCGSQHDAYSINVEYSSDHGRHWSLLQTECLPGTCVGAHWPYSTVYSSDTHRGWSRITVPLPYAALTSSTRLRWIQPHSASHSRWALDNVYIGSHCPDMCSEGHCSSQGCRCDLGYGGPACELSARINPNFLSESFNGRHLHNNPNFLLSDGGVLGFGCGVLASGKAAVFSGEGRRQLVTADLDSTYAKFLQFTIRIGSNSVLGSCRPPNRRQEESFNGRHLHNNPNFLLSDGGVLGFGCGVLASGKAAVFSGEGRRQLVTADLDSTYAKFLQFTIRIGSNSVLGSCRPPNRRQEGVLLHFSTDSGVTWQLLKELHFDEYKEPRIESLPLPSEAHHPHVRFRWWQPRHSGANQDVWALDEVTMTIALYNTISLDFSNPLDVNNALSFHQGVIGHHCGRDNTLLYAGMYERDLVRYVETQSMQIGTSYMIQFDLVMGCGNQYNNTIDNRDGVRQLVSLDMDTTEVNFIQFYIRLGGGDPKECNSPDRREEGVLLQYSNDGGISWELLRELYYADYSSVRFVYVELPPEAMTPITRFRWWQPQHSGHGFDQWALDGIYIGNTGSQVSENVVGDLSDPVSEVWMEVNNGAPGKYCGSQDSVLLFNTAEGNRFAITKDLDIRPGDVLQFRECDGSNWDFHEGSTFYQGDYKDWRTVVILVSERLAAHRSRFRWLQQIESNAAAPVFAIDDVYVGPACLDMCSGHGTCSSQQCTCQPGYSGPTCTPNTPHPAGFRDRFDEDYLSAWWEFVHGGHLGTGCGAIADGNSLYFDGQGTREARTVSLDTTNADRTQWALDNVLIGMNDTSMFGFYDNFSPMHHNSWYMVQNAVVKATCGSAVGLMFTSDRDSPRYAETIDFHVTSSTFLQFDLVMGCGDVYTPTSQVELQYSLNMGRTWRLVWQACIPPAIGCDSYQVGSVYKSEAYNNWTRVTVYLPPAASSPNTRFRWAQPQFNPSKDMWAIDNIYLGDGCPWMCSGHGSCDKGVCLCDPGYVGIFCVPERPLPRQLKDTFDDASSSRQWLQVLGATRGSSCGILASGAALVFRKEREDSNPMNLWALDDVYIGPSCPDMCHGHGQCRYPSCICDEGYTGDSCKPIAPPLTSMKESFHHGVLLSDQWLFVEGGQPGQGCGVLADGDGLYFSGPGLRQAVTRDMDLRGSTFLQYHAQIGSEDDTAECRKPRAREESVLLQYSLDGGITWILLHELDHEHYTSPQQDYITLPPEARTASTRLRWWQPVGRRNQHVSIDDPMAEWALDDIMVGGADINPSSLWETFEFHPNDALWEFWPNGAVSDETCGNVGGLMTWTNQQSDGTSNTITTMPLIVSEGYVLQFKIVVGCGMSDEDSCASSLPVLLEFSTDPQYRHWEPVLSECLPANDNSIDCIPYHYHGQSQFSADDFGAWTRVTIRLPDKVISSMTQFRWTQLTSNLQVAPQWAIDDVYVGEACDENLCGGHGHCGEGGRCACDDGYQGERCEPAANKVSNYLKEGFETGTSITKWSHVRGGAIGLGCGSLRPFGQGKSLYFNGCGVREVRSVELDTTKSSKIMFVLQIGSRAQTSTCNINLNSAQAPNKAVVLQYSTNNGIDWYLIKSHDPAEFMRPQRVSYNIPQPARTHATVFRWWQPEHDGKGHDQWAIDNVELVL
uniref:Reelin n=1 Tax=Branchiostoma floridae TaxID=7739 RepID=C3Z2M5_BRAFL|eukprot:XP_002597264.1 hypothetical protein BRAFLDRAFT_66399 [Branchiostoma floridae]